MQIARDQYHDITKHSLVPVSINQLCSVTLAFSSFLEEKRQLDHCCWTGAQPKELIFWGYASSLWQSNEINLRLLGIVPGL